jgi:hypothetical protein
MAKTNEKLKFKRLELTDTHAALEGGELLGDLIDMYGEDAYLDIETYYDTCTIFVKEIRLETDEEYAERITKMKLEESKEIAEKKQSAKDKLAQEKKDYLRLKAKFEKVRR